MVILICFLVVLLCFSFGYNVFHLTEFRCFQSLVDENNELFHENIKIKNQLSSSESAIRQKLKLLNYRNTDILELKNQLKESEANRELKGKRINEEMTKNARLTKESDKLTLKYLNERNKLEQENDLLKVKLLRLDSIIKIYDKSIPEFRTNLTYSYATNTTNILKKYVNYAGYKHLDIKFTKQEKQILKNLESCK